MWQFFVDNFDLYRDPIAAGTVAGAILGLLGVYVVSRRIVFVSAALSQTAALGAALGFFLAGWLGLQGASGELAPPVVASALSLAVVWGLTAVGDRPTLGRDAVLGIAFVVPMALTLVLGAHIAQDMHEIELILHGSAVAVRQTDLWAILGAGALILVTQLVAFRGFVFASLDPVVARTQGVPVGLLDALLFGAIALMTGLSTRALGALPTFGLTVLPAIGALGLRVGLRPVFVVATITGAVVGGGGYLVAVLTDWSVGACQTLLAAALAVVLRLAGLAIGRK